MVSERAVIEKAYSSNLRKWSEKWNAYLQPDITYNTSCMPWKGLCVEAESLSEAHSNISNALMLDIQSRLKQFQKEKYPKAQLPLNTTKKSKQLEQEFEQAQKPWAKQLKKVHHQKKEYYQACKTERYLQVQVQNSKSEISGNTEQARKLQEKWDKSTREVESTRDAYEGALNDLKGVRGRYLEDMARVFKTAQDFEGERLQYFKSVFSELHRTLDITQHADLAEIYQNLSNSIAKNGEEDDLSWWSKHHGVDMTLVEPTFEEYSPELAAINRKRSQYVGDGNPGITVTSIQPVVSPNSEQSESVAPEEDTSNPFGEPTPPPIRKEYEESYEPSAGTQSNTGAIGGLEYTDEATFDDGRPGVKVRALYDYISLEDDELSLKAGDVFEKLEDPDEQGWCKGRKDGRAGLYPANYAEEW